MGRSKGTSPTVRQLRVGEELRHALVRVLDRSAFDDPQLAGVSITVTEVRVSPDLKNATAYVIPLGGVDMPATVAALRRAAGYFRGQIGREINLRYTPGIDFAADRSFEQARRVDELLARPRVRQDLAAPATDDDEEPSHGA